MKRLSENEVFDILHLDGRLNSPEELAGGLFMYDIVNTMSGAERDVLRAIFLRGPIEDGGVPSKSGRDTLLKHGYCTKVVVRGEEGYNACTYLGASAYRLMLANLPVTPE